MNKKNLPWIITAVSVVLLGGILLSRRLGAATHPDPRVGVTAANVLPAETMGLGYRAAEAYRVAAAIPETLDGLYCHCRCKENFQHRSLLSCFESEHGASCDICIGEALIAAQMRAQGESLDAIRRAIDAQYKG
jgi:hypothetical protein